MRLRDQSSKAIDKIYVKFMLHVHRLTFIGFHISCNLQTDSSRNGIGYMFMLHSGRLKTKADNHVF